MKIILRTNAMRLFMLFLIMTFTLHSEAQSLSSKKENIDYTIADSLYLTGNYAKAINYYSKAEGENASLQIARAYSAIGNYPKAIAQYKNLVEQNPTLQIASFELGKLLIKTKDYDGARILFSKLSGQGRENPEYHYYLGEVYKELQQPASSLMAFKKAIEKDSTHLRSLFQLGKYFTVKRERDRALKYVDTGLRFYDKDVALINLKALIYYNDSQFENAIPWFEKVLELGETKPYVYEKLAYCYYKNWEFEKAKETYRTLIAIDEQNSDSYFGMAYALRKNKQLDSAEIYIKKAMDVQRPIFREGYTALAGLARERNNLKSALNNYKLAYKEVPDAMGYYQICTVADRYYQDPKIRLEYYENFIKKFGAREKYMSKTVQKRISELKEEIHLAKN